MILLDELDFKDKDLKVRSSWPKRRSTHTHKPLFFRESLYPLTRHRPGGLTEYRAFLPPLEVRRTLTHTQTGDIVLVLSLRPEFRLLMRNRTLRSRRTAAYPPKR